MGNDIRDSTGTNEEHITLHYNECVTKHNCQATRTGTRDGKMGMESQEMTV